MKKTIVSLLIAIFSICESNSQSLFQMSIQAIDGDTVNLNIYTGKKILFFILPLNQNDSNFTQLQAFKNRYLDTVQIIGVLSIEDGYQASNAAAIQSMYSGMGIVITQGMYTKKTSGVNQSQLMRWLTDKTYNIHFNMDAAGIGHKFFVNESGRLYAVMPPQTKLDSPVIDRIIHSTNQ